MEAQPNRKPCYGRVKVRLECTSHLGEHAVKPPLPLLGPGPVGAVSNRTEPGDMCYLRMSILRVAVNSPAVRV